VRHAGPYVHSDDPMSIDVSLDAPERLDDLVVALSIFDQNGIHVHGTSTAVLGVDLRGTRGRVDLQFDLDDVPLLDGAYSLSVGAHTTDGGVLYDQRDGACRFNVQSGSGAQGVVALPFRVTVTRP
jgi:hypothetical protein